MSKQSAFVGGHTLEKLDAVEKYLQAFQTALKKQKFHTVFFDAFAGTGDLPAQAAGQLLDGVVDPDQIAEGSARRALRIKPPFDEYIFVEQMKGKAAELLALKTDFNDLAPRISVIHGDANRAVADFCGSRDWARTRMVCFLDPFGNQVSFSTIEAVAKCNIDLWYLFPAGIGVNRQISGDGTVVASAEPSLDRMYGTADWRTEFIQAKSVPTLFGDENVLEKNSSAEIATRFMIRRMKTVFGGRVLDSWLPLGRNGGHWYSLIFACGNPEPKAWKLDGSINAIFDVRGDGLMTGAWLG